MARTSFRGYLRSLIGGGGELEGEKIFTVLKGDIGTKLQEARNTLERTGLPSDLAFGFGVGSQPRV